MNHEALQIINRAKNAYQTHSESEQHENQRNPKNESRLAINLQNPSPQIRLGFSDLGILVRNRSQYMSNQKEEEEEEEEEGRSNTSSDGRRERRLVRYI